MISRNRIDQLIEKTEDVNLTITLPTHKKGDEVQQDPIRFKNLLNQAENRLLEQGFRKPEIEALLKDSRLLLDDYSFWNHTDQGMAVYINNDLLEVFELPYELNERVYAGDHFLVTPLLPMISLDGTYCILALSPKNLRLLRCTRDSVVDITPEDILTNIEDFVEDKPEVQLQFHTGADNHDAMYFGHGGNEEDKKIVVEKYLRGVEESITSLLKQTGEPLVLMASEEIITIYRSLNKYKRVLDTPIRKYPGDMKDKELQETGWEVIEGYFLKDMYEAIEEFNGENTDMISNNLSRIVESTVMGKTDTLFIARGEENWGIYDESEHTVHYDANYNGRSNELLNWTALKAMKQGGKVYVLPKQEMPHAATVAALFRF